MITYFDEPYAKVWADALVPCVYTSIKKPLAPLEFDNVARKQLSCVIELNKSMDDVYSITDFTECVGLTRQEAIAYMTKVVEREFRLGISRKFFVRSRDKASRDSLIHGLVATSSLNFYVYETFSEVLKEINSIKTLEAPAKQRRKRSISIIPRLIKHFFAGRFAVRV